MISILAMLSAIVNQGDTACVNLSTMVKNETYLRSNLHGVIKTPSLLDCGASCQSHVGCLSFGFEPRKRLCHLHKEDESSASHDIVQISHWIHGDLSALPKKLWGPCTDHNCTAGQKCTRNRVTKKAVCVKADLSTSQGHCPNPPLLDNANISSGGQEPGTKRTYTCQEGYLDTESFLSSGVITCLPGFTWSSPNITCSGPFIRVELNSFEEKTFQDEGFEDVTGNTSSIAFFYKGCGVCMVWLCNSSFSCYLIETRNTSIIINKINGRTQANVFADDVLSCDEFRPLWISWLDGTIAVGKGLTVGSQEMIRWEPEFLLDLSAVGLGVRGNNNGTWLIVKHQ